MLPFKASRRNQHSVKLLQGRLQTTVRHQCLSYQHHLLCQWTMSYSLSYCCRECFDAVCGSSACIIYSVSGHHLLCPWTPSTLSVDIIYSLSGHHLLCRWTKPFCCTAAGSALMQCMAAVREPSTPPTSSADKGKVCVSTMRTSQTSSLWT